MEAAQTAPHVENPLECDSTRPKRAAEVQLGPQSCSHTHTHTEQRAVINRLARANGHLASIKRMVEDGRDCAEVLVQLAAVRAALNNTAKIIIKDHMNHCLLDAAKTDDLTAIENLNRAIDLFYT